MDILKTSSVQRRIDYPPARAKEVIALVALILLLLTFAVLPEPTLAHPPADMELEYDIDTQTLFVSITHPVSNPESHYVKNITIKKNGDLYLTEDYSNQPATPTFTYTYEVTAVDGDVLEAAGDCSLYGSVTEQITVSAPSISPTPTSVPAPTVTPTPQIPGFEVLLAFVGLLVLAVVYRVRKRK